jgi:uncharacterized protein UPF0158
MSVPVKLKDIIEALQLASDSSTYYLDRRTGHVEIITEDIIAGMEEDDSFDDHPEWLREAISKAQEIQNDEGGHFVELPSKFDLDDHAIMEEFSRKYPDSRVSATLLEAIKGKGAFRNFNDLISKLKLQDKWNQFQYQAHEGMAVDWLEANGIPYTRDDEIEVSGEM